MHEYKNKSSKMWAGGQNVQLECKYVEGIHWYKNNVQYVLKLCYFIKSYQYFFLNLNLWEESTPYCWNTPPTPKRRAEKRVETSKECVGWLFSFDLKKKIQQKTKISAECVNTGINTTFPMKWPVYVTVDRLIATA